MPAPSPGPAPARGSKPPPDSDSGGASPLSPAPAPSPGSRTPDRPASAHVVVMGVSGCGKTSVARALADRLGRPMAEADSFHSPASVALMSAGRALTDADRAPWLAALRTWLDDREAEGHSGVMACSALRRRYRDLLRRGTAGPAGREVFFVHLAGDRDLIAGRMAARRDHYMPTSLLDSQFAVLEPLESDELGVTLDVTQTLDLLVEAAAAALEGVAAPVDR